jgi:Arc/MetJ-type ribon-helix-helix transcriptional regulator
MERVTVTLPPKLKAQAQRRAKEKGVSISDLIREPLEVALKSTETHRRKSDPLFMDEAVFHGDAPADRSQNHDRYVYED